MMFTLKFDHNHKFGLARDHWLYLYIIKLKYIFFDIMKMEQLNIEISQSMKVECAKQTIKINLKLYHAENVML